MGALQAGIPASDFWELTPKETIAAMDAALWRLEQEQQGRAWLAWHTAAFIRSRRLPPLGRVLKVEDAKPLDDDELDKRRSEFEELKKRLWPAKSN